MGLLANETGTELAHSNYPGSKSINQGSREVRCYPPVSQPLSGDLTPLEQIAQHAEQLFQELMVSLSGDSPPVVAEVMSGDTARTTLCLHVGPCPHDQACQAMALVRPLNEGTPSTHLLDGCVAGLWRIDKLDIEDRPGLNGTRPR